MKKKELCFAAGIFLIAILSLLFITHAEDSDEAQVKITLNGSIYGVYSLTESQEIEIADEQYENVVCIENGKVYMKTANCPDKYCVEQGAITNEKQTIVCLPHKLVIEIIKEENMEDTVDIITK